MSATQNNAFVATIDNRDYSSVSFATEPIVNGCLFYGAPDRVSLSDLEKDGWAEHIAVTDEEDCPELREELAGILVRRFESTREAQERQRRIEGKREAAGLPRREFPIGAPAPPVTLKMVQRAQYDSAEARDMNIRFFERYGTSPEKFDDDDGGKGDGKPLPPTKMLTTNTDASNWRETFKRMGELDSGDVRMLIDGIMPEGTIFIGALSGHGKTLLGLSIAKALTTGEPFLGRFPVKEKIPVIYLIPESTGRAFRKRLERFHIPDSDMFLCRTISEGKVLALDHPQLLEAIRVMKPVVILDTAIRFTKSTDENAAMQNKQLNDDILTLRDAGAVAVIGVHHSTKGSRNEVMGLENVLRGTGDLGAMCDAVYGIRRDETLYDSGNGPNEIDIVCVKPRDFDPPRPFRIASTIKKDNKIVSVIDRDGDFSFIEGLAIQEERDQRLVNFLLSNNTVSRKELAEEFHMTEWKVRQLAKKLGWTKSEGPRGVWTQAQIGNRTATPDIEV